MDHRKDGIGPPFFHIKEGSGMSAGKGKKRLTAKQREYARRRAAGESYSSAYIGAGYSGTGGKEVATSNAYNLEHCSAASTEILHRIEALRARADTGAVMDRSARLVWLSDMIMNEDNKPDDRLRAADMLNRMSGDYTDRAQVTYSGGLSLSYEERRQALIDSLSGSEDLSGPQ